MLRNCKYIIFFLFSFNFVLAAVKSTSSTSFEVVGRVNPVMSVKVADALAQIDLNQNTTGQQKQISKLRFSYNEDLQLITLASSALTNSQQFGSSSNILNLGLSGKCDSLKPVSNLSATNEDINSSENYQLTMVQDKAMVKDLAVDEECQLVASLNNKNGKFSAGVYSMNVLVTMVAF